MGSIIQSTVLLKNLRKNFPDAEIVFVTTSPNREIIRQIPFVTRCIEVNDSGFFSLVVSLTKTLLKIRNYYADLFIDLETFSNFAAAITALSHAKFKSGTSFSYSGSRYHIYDTLVDLQNSETVSENYLQLLPFAEDKKSSQLYSFPESENAGQSIFKKVAALTGEKNNKFIVINANASDLCTERRWPLENYVSLARLLAHEVPDHIFLFSGSRGEFEFIERIKLYADEILQRKLFNTCGLFSFAELSELLGKSNLLITNDSGPMHLALAKGINMVALFGPNSPHQYAANNNCHFIYHPVPCSPCIHLKISPPCHGDNICMKNISVQTVFNSCLALLQNIPGTNTEKNKMVLST